MQRSAIAWSIALLALPVAARAQDSTHTAARRDSALVLDHTFNAPVGEPIRVFLAKGVTYRAEVRGNGIALQLRPIMSSVQPPLIERLLSGQSAGEETIYTVQPRADAEYEFVTNGGTAGTAVSLRVYSTRRPKGS